MTVPDPEATAHEPVELPQLIGDEDDETHFIWKHDVTETEARVALALYAKSEWLAEDGEAFSQAMAAVVGREWFRYDDPNNDESMARCDATSEGAIPFIVLREPSR